MPNWPINDQSRNPLIAVQVAKINDLIRELDEGNQHWLTDSELARYQAITSSPRKNQFLTGHYLVRKMASRIFKNLPFDWIYYQDAEHMRRLKCNKDSQLELYVSISHSGEWIAAAISHAPIGIDIETFTKLRNFLAIANHVFSESEITHLKYCDSEELKQNFYLYWTLKECVAKQYGHGLRFETSRAQTPISVSESEQACMHSWQCNEYVVSLATTLPNDIDKNGLCSDAIHQRWQNIASNL